MLLYGTQHTAPNSGPYVLYTTPLPIVKAKLPFSDRFAEHNRRMFSPILTTRRFFKATNTDYTLPITKNIMEPIFFVVNGKSHPNLVIDLETRSGRGRLPYSFPRTPMINRIGIQRCFLSSSFAPEVFL